MSEEIEFVIEPSGSWVRIPWKELLHYRDLLFILVRRDFVAKYKQTILGPLWFIIQPLFYTLVFTVFFKRMAKFPTGDMPGVLFYYSGMLAWQYFAQCMNGTSQTFVQNAGLFGKVYFPRLVVPLSVIISNLLAYGLQFVAFIAFFIYYNYFTAAGEIIHPNWNLLYLPLIILQTAALGLGVGLWMSALTAKYRDFAHVSGFLSQLWMFSTLPLLRSLEGIDENLTWLLAVNPVCSLVRWYRVAFLGMGTVDATHMAISVGVTVLLLVTGVLIFSRVEKTFIDTV